MPTPTPTHPRRVPRWWGVRRALPLLATAAVVTLTGVVGLSGTAGAAAAAATAGANPTWVGYFFPLKVGWTCHESLTGGGATGDETLTVSAVAPVSQGRSVTIDEGSSSTVGTTSVPTNAALHYILAKGGQLISVPSGLQVAGQPYSITGDTTYPSIKTLLAGGSAVSHLHIAALLSPADRAELQGVLPAKATSLEMAVDVAQRGSSLETLQTPLGTFHHVLVVHSVAKSIAFTNIGKAASKELAGAILPTVAKQLSSTAWYAPGLGPIKDSADGFTATDTSCGAAAG
jgi:hypothetical protein